MGVLFLVLIVSNNYCCQEVEDSIDICLDFLQALGQVLIPVKSNKGERNLASGAVTKISWATMHKNGFF